MSHDFIPSIKKPGTCKSCGGSVDAHPHDRSRGRPMKYSEEVKNKFLTWYLAQSSLQAKCEELGIAYSTAKRILADAGISGRMRAKS